MTHIKSIIEKREEVYNEFTDAILGELHHVTNAATLLLPEDLQPRLVWKNVTLVDDTLIVSGMLEFPIGEKIVTDDEIEVEVTAEMQSLLNRVVRVGVPMDMVENSTTQQIIEYLTRLEDEANQQVFINESLNTSNETVDDMAGDFHSAGLTQEQIISMITFAEQSKGKVN